jgi:hypothetical protein
MIINFSARQTACSELDDWFIARDAGSVSLFHDEIVEQSAYSTNRPWVEEKDKDANDGAFD